MAVRLHGCAVLGDYDAKTSRARCTVEPFFISPRLYLRHPLAAHRCRRGPTRPASRRPQDTSSMCLPHRPEERLSRGFVGWRHDGQPWRSDQGTWQPGHGCCGSPRWYADHGWDGYRHRPDRSEVVLELELTGLALPKPQPPGRADLAGIYICAVYYPLAARGWPYIDEALAPLPDWG